MRDVAVAGNQDERCVNASTGEAIVRCVHEPYKPRFETKQEKLLHGSQYVGTLGAGVVCVPATRVHPGCTQTESAVCPQCHDERNESCNGPVVSPQR